MPSQTFSPGTVVTSTWLNEVNTTVFNKTIDVKHYGAVGDGLTNDTLTIQTAINAALSGDTIKFRGSFVINTINFIDKNLNVDALGATFILVGDRAGFRVSGSVSNFTVMGGVIVGDGANRDSDSSLAQVGWQFGDLLGSDVKYIFVSRVKVENTNVGFKLSQASLAGATTDYCKVDDCHVKNMVGTVGGTGYGFQFSNAYQSTFTNCSADNCQRHSFYFAEGRNYTMSNCIIKNHRASIGDDGFYRTGVSISRSASVTVSNCVFDNCYGGAMSIDTDSDGTPPDNISNGTTVSNCVFRDSSYADIRIGTNPIIDGNPKNIIISSCIFRKKAGNNEASLLFESGENVKINNCLFDGAAAGASFRAISLNAVGGSTYTTKVVISNNTILSSYVGIQIASQLQTGTADVKLLYNTITATAELEFVGGENITVNNSLIYKRTNGKNSFRVFTTTGTGLTVPVGGVDVITFDQSLASTITTFSGAVDGDELIIYFANGNTTILAASIYLAGATNFVGSSADVLTLLYKDGAWREKSRSVN